MTLIAGLLALVFALDVEAGTVRVAGLLGAAWAPRPITYLMGLSELTYLVQGWVAGEEGFSQTLSNAIVLAWVLSLACMPWLGVGAWRMQEAAPHRLTDDGGGRAAAIPTSSR